VGAGRVIIREECPGDVEIIHELTEVAFRSMAFSDGSEPRIIRSLRDSGDLALSLVAEKDGAVAGHVAFSPVAIEGVDGDWFGLGPISVWPDLQRRGIGKALVKKGLETLRQRGARGCALIGDPNVYSRMGFESDGSLSYGDLDRRYVQRIVFSGSAPRGTLKFAPAFQPE
jgi:putative acetyltransferase